MQVVAIDRAPSENLRQRVAVLGWEVREVVLTVDKLVALQPALLAVTELASLPSVSALKASPATRRIPVLAVLASSADFAQALRAGCDGVIDEAAFWADPQRHLQQHARSEDRAAARAELLRQAALPLPALAHKAIEQFNAGEYFEQHETFEELWRAEPGPIRQLYQGLLQVGVAYLQIQRKNYDGARKLFQRAWQYLNALPDVAQGIDVAQFRAEARAAQEQLEQLGPERIAEFPTTYLKPIQFTISD